MNKFAKILLCSIALSLAFLTSCKKDKVTNHEIEFRVIASSNSTITAIVHSSNQSDYITLTDIGAKTWSSGKINFKSSVKSVSLKSDGTSPNTDGSLKVQIYVDGEMKKESISTGKLLNTSTIYEF